MFQDLAMTNKRLDHMAGQREQMEFPDTHQEEVHSSCELRGKTVIPYTPISLECCDVASSGQLDVVTDLPRTEVFKSPYGDTLSDVRSCEYHTLVVSMQTLVDPLNDEIDFSCKNDLCPSSARPYNLNKVPLPINKSTHTLVDPCENQGDSMLVYGLPPTSEGVQNNQSGEDDLDLFESIGNPNCNCTCENGFGRNPLAAHDGVKLSMGYPFEMEYDRNPCPWLLLPFDSGAILEYVNWYQEDVQLMVDIGFEAYRFSISWSRLILNGRGPVNPKGLQYYNNLIDELISHGPWIQPHVTLYHCDLPQALEDENVGWLRRKIVKDFTTFADVCFKEFGDKVLHWTTINEANILSFGGYDNGLIPPNHCSTPFRSNCTGGNSSTESVQQGFVGISVYGSGYLPYTNSTADVIAVKRIYDFYIGWFQDLMFFIHCKFIKPLIFGDYPQIMKKNVGSRLPRFSKSESELVKGSLDFIGLNHYNQVYAKDNPTSLEEDLRDFTMDTGVEILLDTINGEINFSSMAPPTFDRESYQIWAVRMRIYLQALDLWEAVEDEYEIAPLLDNPTVAQIKTHKERKTRKSKAMTCLFTVVSSNILTHIMSLQSAKELLDKGFKLYFKDKYCLIKEASGQDLFKVKMRGRSFSLNPLEEEHGFHLLCVEPPLLKEDIPLDDEGCLCPGCDCKVDCIDLLNDLQRTNLFTTDSWEKVYPKEAAATSGEKLDDIYELPSDDSENGLPDIPCSNEVSAKHLRE
ncbi:Beta-glucosidase 11 [Capsicum annuum]|uniref:Beta-glucosidase 11 n=1 Tax=Capsicum annuum TaxID=4072 RepID=A0A2G2ZW64_CAPAN|nr:Beta-glucosidase 11 [Capsicum annuum]KAF3665279.1 Beta-glucosidase 11 [Capsicum annuum]PHT86223.1 Beta-glucosidase 11 [Capsicum annuum]